MKNRSNEPADNWGTPKAFYDVLNAEFNFDFDPCPLTFGALAFDGLLVPWGRSNWINPPYSAALKKAFVEKALQESRNSVCVLLLPVSTSTILFHNIILPYAKEIRFVQKRIPFIGVNTKGEYVNWHLEPIVPTPVPTGVHVKNSGMHDSMIVIFDGRATA